MPFTIPNDVPAGTAKQHRQATPFQTDFDILAAAHGLTGVRSGCQVTTSGGGLTVLVNAGTSISGAVTATVAAVSLTLAAADATNPRIDLVIANPAGVASVIAGTPSPTPRPPSLPVNNSALAYVDVSPLQTAVGAGDITDKRMVIAASAGSGGGGSSGLFDARGAIDYFHLGDPVTGDLPAPGTYEERWHRWDSNVQILGFALTAGFTHGPVGADVVVDVVSGSGGVTLWGTNPANRPKIVAGANASAAETVPDTTLITAGTDLRAKLIQRGLPPSSGGVYGGFVVLSMRYVLV